MANVSKRKSFSFGAEKHGVNAFPQNEIEHFECCDDDIITSGESTPLRRTKHAKVSAVSQFLDEEEEVNEPIMTPSVSFDNDLQNELGEIEEEFSKEGIPGKNRRQVPVFLKDVKPESGKVCFLNLIHMELIEPLLEVLNPRRRPLFDPEKTPIDFALLCTVKLPSVSENLFDIVCK
ncbi:hypothetical protein AVEN_98097-1 [Araneus ventricosus]|uniref:Dicer platform domain-containing protein n=1 Tax=Araneus ventricosus TaxID=182803 RepID=A0A4Y2L787_ARAVE|nr:hypothetical protein AVEN_98097-1 [Araneus ventricosus]